MSFIFDARIVKDNPKLSDVTEFACHQIASRADIAREAERAVEHGLRTGILSASDGQERLTLECEVCLRMHERWDTLQRSPLVRRDLPRWARQKRALD